MCAAHLFINGAYEGRNNGGRAETRRWTDSTLPARRRRRLVDHCYAAQGGVRRAQVEIRAELRADV